MKEKLEKIYKNSIFLRIIGLSLNIISAILVLIGVLAIAYNDTLLVEKINFNDGQGIVAFAVLIITVILGICQICFGIKNVCGKKCFLIESIMSIAIQIVLISLGISFDIFGFGNVFLLIITIIVMIVYCIHTVLESIYGAKIKKEINYNRNYVITLIMNIISILALSSIFFIPLYTGYYNSKEVTFIIIDGLMGTNNIIQYISFIITFLVYIASVCVFLHTLKYYYWHSINFSKASKESAYINFAVAIVYFIVGNTVVFYLGTNNNYNNLETYSWIPFVILSIITLLHSFINSKNEFNEGKSEKRTLFGNNIIILVFVTLFTAVTIASLFTSLIHVESKIYNNSNISVTITGIDLLMNPSKTGSGFTVLAFVFLVIVICAIVMFIITLTATFTRSKEQKRIALATIIMNFAFIFIVGLFGKYYEITSIINIEQINELIDKMYGYKDVLSTDIGTVDSGCFYLIFIDVFFAIVLFFFKPFTKAEKDLADEINLKNDEPIKIAIAANETKSDLNEIKEDTENETNVKKTDKEEKTSDKIEEEIAEKNEDILPQVKVIPNFDSCPAFTELDNKLSYYNDLLFQRKNKLFENPSLPDIVQFVVDYARESRLHLSYTPQTIAKFVAGLGATKLSILQGMSGTGKTSLPKIFLEALMGNCEIVEVESSWKDKNELIGYYNEFSKVFTPKKFTRMLYKASLNHDVITFIVLDEMNLSRIEYYFSDFLSLMENEPEKREIQLCNVTLTNDYDNEKHQYLSLIDGHTLHIPQNVWFIGTANRDESTFEISDKVYDRAATMNFNQRAPKVRNYSNPIESKYLSYDKFEKLLEKALKEQTFDLESVSYVNDVEALLRPYNISFGNRIMNQIEAYVKIYISCFTNSKELIDEALEDILLSKVVSKLEFKAVEDKESLISSFEKLKLFKCAEFVSKLNEDL